MTEWRTRRFARRRCFSERTRPARVAFPRTRPFRRGSGRARSRRAPRERPGGRGACGETALWLGGRQGNAPRDWASGRKEDRRWGRRGATRRVLFGNVLECAGFSHAFSIQPRRSREEKEDKTKAGLKPAHSK